MYTEVSFPKGKVSLSLNQGTPLDSWQLKSIRFHLRQSIAPEASLRRKSPSLNQLAKIFCGQVCGVISARLTTACFSLVVTPK